MKSVHVNLQLLLQAIPWFPDELRNQMGNSLTLTWNFLNGAELASRLGTFRAKTTCRRRVLCPSLYLTGLKGIVSLFVSHVDEDSRAVHMHLLLPNKLLRGEGYIRGLR